MSTSKLPSGRYLSCPIDLSPDAGGQTRALLMRNRIFVTEAGIHPMIATFNARTDLAERRATLLERGMLLPEISTPNIYEHYRSVPWDDQQPAGEELPDLSVHKANEEFFPDGSPFRVVYTSDRLERTVYDYQRPDGSTYLRIPEFVFKEPDTWPRSILRVSPDGTVSGEFRSVAQFSKRFVRDLVGEERAFVFVDSRFNAQHLIPIRARNIHLVYVLHNIHVAPPRLWSSPLSDIYGRLLSLVDGVDAFVTLTQRQQDDIAMRRGRGNNLFVIPNPVDLPPRDPELPTRDPNRVAVVARLELQKRLGHAIRAFAKAREVVPTARLDIYGSGSRMAALQETADRLGVADAVTLHGHDPRAREALWHSSAFLMTSMFEGYPLSTLESMSHGCPVVSYDIKYGPREQITDGVDGFLVPNRDLNAMAERIVTLLTSPELVDKMSEAALEKARGHGHGRFLDEWRQVLETVIEQKPGRTSLDEVRLDVRRLSVRGRRGRGSSFVPTVTNTDGRLRFDGVLHVRGSSRSTTLDAAEVSLEAVHFPTGKCVPLALSVSRKGDEFRVSSRFAAGDVFGEDESLHGVRLRLRLVWQNSTWETFLSRPDEQPHGIEASFADGVLELSARP